MPFWSERFCGFERVLFRRSKGGWTALRMGVSRGWKERFLPSSSAMCIDFSSHRRIGTGYHAACVSNLNKTQREPIIIFEFFAMCTFPWTRNEFVKTYALNNIHFWSGHTVFDVLFVFSRFHVFLTPERDQTRKNGTTLSAHSSNGASGIPKGPIPSQNMGLQVHDTSVNTAMSV